MSDYLQEQPRSAPPAPENAEKAFQLADQIVLKEYIKYLSQLPVVALEAPRIKEPVREGGRWVGRLRNIRASDQASFFRIGKLVYDSEENNLQKLTNIYSAIASLRANVGMILHSDGRSIEMYLGVCGEPDRNRIRPNAEALYNYLTGNFQGSLEPYETASLDNEELNSLMSKCFSPDSMVVSSVSGVASMRADKPEENMNFNQGLEKLADAMRGKPFTALLIANSVPPEELADIRAEYELLYSTLVPFSKSSLTLSDTQSDAVTKTLSQSLADTVGTNSSAALSVGTNKSQAHTEGVSVGQNDTIGLYAGGEIGPVHAGGNYSHSFSRTKSFSDTTTFGKNESATKTVGSSKAHTVTKTTSDGTTETITVGKSLQLSYENKTVTNLLERIDSQLARIKSSEAFGMFAAAAYFAAPNRTLAETAASAYKGIISGTNTALEAVAVNTWSLPERVNQIKAYLRLLWHPMLQLEGQRKNMVTPASLISAQELAVQMGLPKKSISGVSIVETAAFGRNIFALDGTKPAQAGQQRIKLGNLYHMGQEDPNAPIALDTESLSMHTFITGSTGSGKSNTVFQLLHELQRKKKHFLVVEPAKGEYKNVFGGMPDVRVYGTNPQKAELLRINPFKFPSDIHILEHLDRLVEIFNAAWPMYAAMPAVLKDSIERAYIAAGWDLRKSVNRYSPLLFPTFQDVLEQIQVVLNESAYSADNKGDYTGALTTRLKSLTNGLNGMIFCCNDIPDKELFDENVVIDLSRVGSVETKSLIMGLLVMKLQEYRLSESNGVEKPLEHVTVLEEAHNLLKRTSTEQSAEGSNLAGKAVEMLANAIAEMRAYGEGFIIADQAPGLMDMSVIRNTNTKIILRLPDQSDRELVGRAAGLNDKQIIELSKLAKGVAAVYQNDWIEAVLCKVTHCRTSSRPYDFTPSPDLQEDSRLTQSLLEPLLRNELDRRIDEVDRGILLSSLPTQFKCRLSDYLRTDKNQRSEALARVAYSFFNSQEIMKKCHPNMSVSEFTRTALEYIEPPLDGFSKLEKEIALLLIIHEQSRRDEAFARLFTDFALEFERSVH